MRYFLFRTACLTSVPLLCLAVPAKSADIVIDTNVSAEYSATTDAVISGNTPPGSRGIAPVSDLTTDINNNTVTITNGAVINVNKNVLIYGADSIVASVENNTVRINGGQLATTGATNINISGGHSAGTASVVGNTTQISGGSFDAGNAVQIFGGHSNLGSSTTTVSENIVQISGGTFNAGAGSMRILGGQADSGSLSTVSENIVQISGGTFTAVAASNGYVDIFGGVSYSSGAVTNNTLHISGGTFAPGTINGGYSFSGAVTGNMVNISGGTLNSGNIHGGYSNQSAATGNTVHISGGTLNVGNIYGGYANTSSGSATGNTVTLSGAPQFLINTTNLYGGGGAIGTGDKFTGNTLNVWDYSGSSVRSIQNFENYSFVLPANMRSGDILLSATGALALGSSAKVTRLDMMGGGTALKAGDQVTLIDAATLTGTMSTANIQGKKGVFLTYDWLITTPGNDLVATVTGVSYDKSRTKVFSEGRLAGLAFLNQGGDLVSREAIRAARRVNDDTGVAPFALAEGGSSRYDTGSHVDVEGASMVAGVAWNNRNSAGKYLLGTFFEGGWGNYNSHNSFSGFTSVSGKGDTEYVGGGILGRFEFPSNIYSEASLRMGLVKTDFVTSDIQDTMGNDTGYHSSSLYFGGHFGVGYVWNMTKASSLDMYYRYSWTHQNSDTANIAGDPVNFKGTDSHRVRVGGRYAYAIEDSGNVFSPYVGGAYEHEFDGKARASVYGFSFDAPDLSGGTGIGELGISFTPSYASGFSFDLGIQGYIGVREGVTGGANFRFAF